jgi:hypothetical protein
MSASRECRFLCYIDFSPSSLLFSLFLQSRSDVLYVLHRSLKQMSFSFKRGLTLDWIALKKKKKKKVKGSLFIRIGCGLHSTRAIEPARTITAIRIRGRSRQRREARLRRTRSTRTRKIWG